MSCLLLMCGCWSLYGSESSGYAEIAQKAGTFAKNALTKGFAASKDACQKAIAGLSSEAKFIEHVYDRTSGGATRELLACSRLCAASMAASCVSGLIHGQMARHFYPEYYTRGYTAQALRGITQAEVNFDHLPYNLLRPIKFVGERLLFGGLNFLPIVHVARAGAMPQLSVRNLILPGAVALGAMAGCSWLAGKIGYRLAQSGAITSEGVAGFCRNNGIAVDGLPEEDHRRCIAATFASNAGYLSGTAATLGLMGWMLHKRCALAAVQ